ncbi:hypothetical protein [Myroides odoratimimus]|uniref:hypothetical protein n=1 Tax=Myroides odoratimimus TaxID=76832 RepID=UPI002578F114|nr:hypothetical protein [Myroides odoratimimus]MDM1060841.1 hypothetical protein [Myroides odoratimimus]
MSKQYTFPILYDEVLQINISKLKEWNYLKPKQRKAGIISWSCNENERGSISIMVDTQCEKKYIELEYNYRDTPQKYKVNLVCVPSNLGKGVIWYFLCPNTNKLCRKLYLLQGMFLHREALKDGLYEIQTYSKKNRLIHNNLKAHFSLDRLYYELYKKNFKKTYKGKPTKKYLRLMKQIQMAEKTSYIEI